MGFAKMYQPLPSHLHVLLRLTWGMRWHRRHARAHRCTGPERSLICSDHPWRWKRSGVTWGNQCSPNVNHWILWFCAFSLFEGVCNGNQGTSGDWTGIHSLHRWDRPGERLGSLAGGAPGLRQRAASDGLRTAEHQPTHQLVTGLGKGGFEVVKLRTTP